MNQDISRRTFLNRSLIGTFIIGFDLSLRRWITKNDPNDALLAEDFPEFDGEFLTEDLNYVNDDFGHIISKSAIAVLLPNSIDDIVKLVRFARKYNIKIVPRGQGHSTFGQSQVDTGVVIDLSTLDRVREINASEVLVDAGATWLKVLEATLKFDRTLPVLTDYLGLSVGGILSVGGLGGQSFNHGALVDNLVELEVVTGKGNLVTCSRDRNSVVFQSVRSSLGQFGIVVGARLRLIPAPTKTRVYTLIYKNLANFIRDQELLIEDGRFDYVEGFVTPDESDRWLYILEVAKHFNPTQEPDDDRLLTALSFSLGKETIEDRDYFDFVNRLAPVVENLQATGMWDIPHPWLNLLLPAEKAFDFIAEVLTSLTPRDIGSPVGLIVLYPMNRDKFNAPFLITPNSNQFFLFSLFRAATPDSIGVEAMLEANQKLYREAIAVGGKIYPNGSVAMNPIYWQQHYQSLWYAFVAHKSRFDPNQILTPEQNIF